MRARVRVCGVSVVWAWLGRGLGVVSASDANRMLGKHKWLSPSQMLWGAQGFDPCRMPGGQTSLTLVRC